MTAKPAVMEATYVDLKFMPGLKVARVSLEIPIERSNEFIQLFGTPDRSNPVWTVVARLAARVPANPEPGAEPEKATGGGVERKYSRSQIAAMKCQDPEFQKFLGVIGQRRGTNDGAADADRILKTSLGIQSKRELDADSIQALAFDRLLTDFDMRNTVRA